MSVTNVAVVDLVVAVDVVGGRGVKDPYSHKLIKLPNVHP